MNGFLKNPYKTRASEFVTATVSVPYRTLSVSFSVLFYRTVFQRDHDRYRTVFQSNGQKREAKRTINFEDREPFRTKMDNVNPLVLRTANRTGIEDRELGRTIVLLFFKFLLGLFRVFGVINLQLILIYTPLLFSLKKSNIIFSIEHEKLQKMNP